MRFWPFSRPAERKENPVGTVISAQTVGQPAWTDRRYDRMADEAYVRNAVAFRCIKLIATAAAMTPWLLEGKGGKEIEDHPLLDLLSRPAPMIGGHSLFEAFYAYLLISGNGYLVGPSLGQRRPPKELWPLRPDRMKVVPGAFGLPQGYEYEANGQKKRFMADPMTGMSEVFHLKEFHPLNDWYGMGRVEPGAYGVDRHNAASAHNKALLDNGARPSGALIFKPVTVGGESQSAPQAVVEAGRKELEKDRVGPDNAGKPLVFGGNIDWQEMGLSPRDMDFGTGKDDAARDICTSFGVPHILIVPGQSTYNNVREAKLELWEDTVLPILDKAVDALNAWLVPQFGDGLKLGVDLDEISALEPRRESKRKSVVELVDKGLLDLEEGREALQYGPRSPEAVKLQRGDAMAVKSLADAAGAEPAMIEPLYRYLMSVGLLPPATTLATFMASWEGKPSATDLTNSLAALGITPPANDPANQPAPGENPEPIAAE